MDERIFDLAETILTNQKEFFVGDPKDRGYFFSRDELKQFAALLVRECASVTEEYRGTEWGKTAECISNRIKEHFGVE